MTIKQQNKYKVGQQVFSVMQHCDFYNQNTLQYIQITPHRVTRVITDKSEDVFEGDYVTTDLGGKHRLFQSEVNLFDEVELIEKIETITRKK